jgi:hypothetical protein
MWLIVDPGPWILGKKVMLPAGVVDRINSEDEVVHGYCAGRYGEG